MEHPDHGSQLVAETGFQTMTLQRRQRILERFEDPERLVEVEQDPERDRVLVVSIRRHPAEATNGV